MQIFIVIQNRDELILHENTYMQFKIFKLKFTKIR
jgi:hypothetical protein